MSILLSCQNLSKSFGIRPLFEGLTFGLHEGERTGLIGPNGAGKSTLLKILAGQETPDDGELTVRRGLRVGYLAQQDRVPESGSGLSVREELVRALRGPGVPDHDLGRRAEVGLAESGFKDPDEPAGGISGGWRKRLEILAQVLREPDLLLLDEPTNHLDIEGVLWLERLLSGLKFSFLVVTHDRRFLERVANRVMELSQRHEGGHFSCRGNYSRFLEKREALFSAQNARTDSVRNAVRREIEWLRRGAKARSTKQQARIERAGELMDELGELEYRDAQGRAVDIDFSGGDRRTKRLAHAVKVEKSMGGRKLFGPMDLLLRPGDKLGLVGENGSGKSTLLNVLAGRLAPDAGTLRRADGLRVVLFDQHREQLDLKLSLRKALCESGDYVHYRGRPIHVRGWAERFLFRDEQLDMPLSRLSGGEQSRVLIARLMLRPADLLLLDEPTNDLDIPSLEVLESSLLEFAGALVLVTHDRYLLDRVSRRLLALDGKGDARFLAGLAQWESWRAEREEPASSAGKKDPLAAEGKPGLSKKEWREWKNMESRIQAAEEEAARAGRTLEDPSVAANADELMKRQQALDTARLKVESLYKRWEDLEARR
ncbi:MAG: ABC-F family ATP-binding cassette domain-containing protein [Elusimicrobiota bacterium]